jgi:DNA-binding transcriptional MerR regulator
MPGEENQALYPIRTVSALTGVNPVTLRAWERRYGLIKPKRTPKGHRLYADIDIERIHRILELLKQGIPISQTRQLLASEPRPIRPVGDPAPTAGDQDPWGDYQNRMHGAVARFDELALDAAYNDALSLYPVDLVTRLLVMPLLRRLRERWETEPAGPAEAHFFNAYMRNKLGARFHHQSNRSQGPKLIAAGLPGEYDEIELLLFALSALTHGYRVVLLGGNTPLKPLTLAQQRADARGLVMYGSIQPAPALINTHLASLTQNLEVPVFLGGETAQHHTQSIRKAGAVPLPSDMGAALLAIDAQLRRRRGPTPV